MTSIRKFIKTILTESSEIVSDWGMYSRDTSYGIKGIIFSKSKEEEAFVSHVMPTDAIIAVISIMSTENECNGAWSVIEVAGNGRAAYDLGYYLSPTGKLTSDKRSMTKDAIESWMKWSKQQTGEPFDNANDPFDDDPNNDCEIWRGSKSGTIKKYNSRKIDVVTTDAAIALNQSYIGKNRYNWDAMKIDLPEKRANSLIIASNEFFQSRYQ